jgi:hypothetical protein
MTRAVICSRKGLNEPPRNCKVYVPGLQLHEMSTLDYERPSIPLPERAWTASPPCSSFIKHKLVYGGSINRLGPNAP